MLTYKKENIGSDTACNRNTLYTYSYVAFQTVIIEIQSRQITLNCSKSEYVLFSFICAYVSIYHWFMFKCEKSDI